MMKFILLFLTTLFSFFSLAQEEMSFQLYFEDLSGNKDTITLGWDSLATDSVDANFGEIDISNQPWNSTFEVRTLQKGFVNGSLEVIGESKKSILRKRDQYSAVFIKIKKSALEEVNMTWDATVFNDSLISGSFMELTEYADPPIWEKMNIQNGQFVFADNNPPFTNCNGQVCEATFKLIFTKNFPSYFSLEEMKNIEFDVYPNPISNHFTIQVPANTNKSAATIKVINALGKVVLEEKINTIKTDLSLATQPKGMYFVQLKRKNGEVLTKKIIKR